MHAVPNEAITAGPHVTWKHVDGPLMSWAGNLHWLTIVERLRIFLRLATVDDIACERWPYLAKTRVNLRIERAGPDSYVPVSGAEMKALRRV